MVVKTVFFTILEILRTNNYFYLVATNSTTNS